MYNQILKSKLKYFLYARKSSESEDRQVASIDAQVNVLKNIAKQEGLEIVEVMTESQSAKAPGRPVFSQLLTRIAKGDAQGILCWKLDRLARNPVDGGSISWMLQSSTIQHIRTHDRNYLPSDNVLMMQVEFGMANQFIRDLSQSTKRGLLAKAERGWYPTYPPIGYIHNPLRKKGDKEILPDPERFDLIRNMFLEVMQGASVSKVLNYYVENLHLRSKLGNKMGLSTFYRILRDPFYYGRFEYPKGSDQWFTGKHKPLISKSEFDMIQSRLDKPHKTREKEYVFRYRGSLLCGECGAMVTAENKTKVQKNGIIRHYVYYHCTKRKDKNCSQKAVQELEIESQIHDILKTIVLPADFVKWALDCIKSDSQKHEYEAMKQMSQYQAQLSKIQRISDGLIEMRAGSEISEEEYLLKRKKLSQEKEELTQIIMGLQESTDDWFSRVEKTFNFAENAPKAFQNGSDQDKRELLSLLGSNLYLYDKKVSIELKKPFELIQNLGKVIESEIGMFEPHNSGSGTNEKEAFYTSFPNLLRE